MPITVGDVANQLGVSPQTIRTWCDTFAAWLSPTATPPSGDVRIFTTDDLAVLALVAEMRQHLVGYEAIKAALERGERGEAPPQDQGETPGGEMAALAIRYERELAHAEGRIVQLEGERDHLREELQAERSARLDAERRAATAEARLEVTEGRALPLDAVQAPEEQKKPPKPWWQFWR